MSKRKRKLKMARQKEMRKRVAKWICSFCLIGAVGSRGIQSDQNIRKADEKLSKGDFLMGQGNERGALEVYARVAETAPERIEPWVKMASVHAAAKDMKRPCHFMKSTYGR